MNVLTLFRKSWLTRVLSAMALLGIAEQYLYPMQAYALTGGPSQPEVQSFEPIATTQMVDPFTGDFSYNIPLFDVGGYPINISYHSGINMEQEASCVGLGWNINPGAINRHLQGVPDDFKGDLIRYEENFKPHVGVNTQFKFAAVDTGEKEIFGVEPGPFSNSKVFIKDLGNKFKYSVYEQAGVVDMDDIGLTLRFGIQYHNYRGVGYEVGFGDNSAIGEKWLKGFGVNYDISFNSFSGYDASAGLSYQFAAWKQTKDHVESKGMLGAGLGIGMNSRTGLRDITFNTFAYRAYEYCQENVVTREPSMKISGGKIYYESGEKSAIHRVGAESSGYNGGMSLLGAPPSFSPTSTSYTKSASYTFSYKTGLQLFGSYHHGTITASVDWYGLDKKVQDRQSFGTLYLKDVSANSNADQFALDYNQIGVKSLNKFTENLHQMNQTADFFTVSGQGTSGSFKPYLGSLGSFYQPRSENRSVPSGNVALEVGTGNFAKLGVNLKYIHRGAYSGKWREEYGNLASNSYNFTVGNGEADWEGVYFKNIGERIGVDEGYYEELGGETPTALAIVDNKCTDCPKPSTGISVRTYVTDKLSHDDNPTGNISRTKRAERNQFWSHLTAEEAEDFGLTKYVSDHAEPHHIGEITITGEDGRRYVYGQALYNTEHKEVTFNLADHANNLNCEPATFTYNTSSSGSNTPDNTLDNKKGKDHVFRSTQIPPYAHAYYLTAVLSVDYVDVDNNGPTPNDLGDYVLFEYESAMLDYQWRTPYSEEYNRANGFVGLLSNDFDDKASYVYGKKEVWYLTEVKSKNQRAVFIYDETGRKDAYEAEGENGGRGSRTLWKLDRIEVYTEHEGALYEPVFNPAPGGSPEDVLLKTVHFAYSYDLCPNIPNNIGTNTGTDHPLIPGTDQNINKGKLTLHKIWFTYQNSNLGEESPYLFQYSETNPAYEPADVDRWGNYKPNNCSGKYNSEFPYSLQDENLVHQYASAWHLTQIELPSGGKINIDYESDDYQYVQDRPAMQMLNILGYGKSAADYKSGQTPSANLYEGFAGGSERRANNFVFVSLPEPVYSNEEFRERYLKDNGKDNIEIYFKVKINLQNKFHPGDKKYEFIDGFATVEKVNETINAGVTSDPNVGWIALERVGLKEGNLFKIHPIAKTAWQFIRLQMPYLAFPASDAVSDPDDFPITNQLIGGLLSLAPEMLSSIRGFNGKMLSERFAQETIPSESVIRLYSASGQKYGGGSRVKTIRFSDEWDQFDENNESASYITRYEYSLEDGSGSSGVASYEPIIGGEENPFKVPVHYEEKMNPLALANHIYDLEPYCEFLYPAAVVGYSRVKISAVLPQDTEEHSSYTITRHADGYTVNEFYTAKDYPTRSMNTTLSKSLKGTSGSSGWANKLTSLFGISTQGVTASQGFQIVLNDMHGKLKSTTVYNSHTDKPVRKTEFVYKDKAEHLNSSIENNSASGSKELDNEVVVLNPDGTYETKMIGVDIEAFVDVNESREITHIPGLDINFEFVQSGIPLLFTLPLPKYRRIENYTLTASLTKVITKSGILIKTRMTDNGHTVETENVAFDAKTGSVLLSKTNNEFEDPVYSMSYPAHWAYDGMGQAYQNTGLEFEFEIVDGIGYANEEQGQFLRKGDEIILPGVDKRYWIFHIEQFDDNGTTKYKFGLLDAAGRIKYNDTYTGKVIRSGHRNMQGLSVGQVVTKSNPLVSGTFGGSSQFSNVLAATAMEYDENWQTFMGFHEIGYECTGTSIPSDCSEGIDFRQNRYRLRNKAVGGLCLGTTAPFGNPAEICNSAECPKATFKRDRSHVNDPANKKIPDESDPTFDKSKTRPAGIGTLMTYLETPGMRFEDWANTGNDWQNQSAPWLEEGVLTASADNSVVRINGFPSCDQKIWKVGYASDQTSTPPYGLFRYYKESGSMFCAEMFTFQYSTDVEILKDEVQVSNMVLYFISVENVSGTDYNYYKVLFPMYPDIVAYMWSTCPDCNNNGNSSGEGTYEGSDGSYAGGTPIWTPVEVPKPGNTQGTLPGGVNPYILGIYGNWRPKRSYIYYDTRNAYHARTQSEDVSGNLNSTNTRIDGEYQDFRIFWNPPALNEVSWTKPLSLGTSGNPWKWNSVSDQYHPNGYEVQTHDVIGIFNSAYFSPVNYQPYFVANNSSLKNAVGENFEDYWEFYFDADCNESGELTSLNMVGIDEELLAKLKRTSYQWNLWTAFTPFAYVSDAEAHTGDKSLYLTNYAHPGASLYDLGNQVPGQLKLEVKLPNNLTRVNYKIFEPGNEDMIDRFNPDQEEYVVSFWVKPGYYGASVDFKVSNAVVTPILPLMAQPIDGWYKKSYKVVFNTPPNGEAVLTFSTNKYVYLDDFRMHPVHAQMKTFTYDKNLLRLTSTLDENNFATFYEYDLEGNLVRVKRETERGIFTISENRKNLRKRP